MGNSNQPNITPLISDEMFKTLNIVNEVGMEMPLNHGTKQAVIVVLKGETILRRSDEENTLEQSTAFIVPEKIENSLKINSDFHAIAIMNNASVLEFES